MTEVKGHCSLYAGSPSVPDQYPDATPMVLKHQMYYRPVCCAVTVGV